MVNQQELSLESTLLRILGKSDYDKASKRIDEINQSGGYAYLSYDKIRINKTNKLETNHVFEQTLTPDFVRYYKGVEGNELLTTDEFVKTVKRLLW